MVYTRYQVTLMMVMLVTGSISTLTTKWIDMMDALNSAGEAVPFDHAFIQSLTMFMGEMLCLIAYDAVVHYKRSKDMDLSTWIPDKHTLFLFYPSALLDMLSSCLMYTGLGMTYASSYQILRGSVIIFTGLLSIIFLKRKLSATAWIGMILMMLGLVIVGLTDFLFSGNDSSSDNSTQFNVSCLAGLDEPSCAQLTGETNEDYTTSGIVTGDILIVIAQIITAVHLVYQEKFYSKYRIAPLQAVGFEGVFGFFTLGVLLIPFYYIPVPESFSGNPRNVMEDALDALVQLGNNGLTLIGLIISIISLAFFNFAGVSVTKELSATTRMVIDSTRTVIVWLVSLALTWQPFLWPHLLGFAVLLVGSCVYNNIIRIPGCSVVPNEEHRPVLPNTTSGEPTSVDNRGLEKSTSESE